MVAALPVVALGIAMLGGCSAAPATTAAKGVEMIGWEQAEAEVRTIFEATKELMGGTWEEDTRSWGACDTRDIAGGVAHSFLAIRSPEPLPGDPEIIAEKLREIWHAHGRTVEKITYDESMDPPRHIVSDPPWLAGRSPDGSLYQSTIGTDYASFQAKSRCANGRLDEYGQGE